jgi:hypothetical protein
VTAFFFLSGNGMTGLFFSIFEEKWSTVKKKKQKTQETEGELPKKGAGLAVGRFAFLFGGHFLLDSHLHLTLQSQLQLYAKEKVNKH